MANFWPQALRHRKYRTALGALLIFCLIAFLFLGPPTFGPSTQNRIDVAPEACTTPVTPNNDILPFAACHINKKVPEKARLISWCNYLLLQTSYLLDVGSSILRVWIWWTECLVSSWRTIFFHRAPGDESRISQKLDQPTFWKSRGRWMVYTR